MIENLENTLPNPRARILKVIEVTVPISHVHGLKAVESRVCSFIIDEKDLEFLDQD